MAYDLIDCAYKGVLHVVSRVVPEQVAVIEGENYGIRLEDPTGKNPSVAVNVEEITDASLELGSAATSIILSCTLNAQSRRQRDALKATIYSGLIHETIPLYSSYDTSYTPASGALSLGTLAVQPGIRIRDMPDLASGRERFFWSAVVFFTVQFLHG